MRSAALFAGRFRRSALIVAALCCLPIGGCDTGSDGGDAAGGATPDGVSVADTGIDISFGADQDGSTAEIVADVAQDIGVADDSTDAEDSTDDDTGNVFGLCNFDDPQAGNCGWPCANDSECVSGFCVATPADNLCTATCDVTDCPPSWVCRQLANAPDVIFGCVPESPNRGRPCTSDLECVLEVGESITGLGDRCVEYGDAGAFCGSDCSKGQACPKGWTCETTTSVSGKNWKQCVATDVNDVCTPRYAFDGASTYCNTTNAIGTCAGSRTCLADALAPCSAQEPALEVCNGSDDDCDGAVDEQEPGATCLITVGANSCAGTPLCVGGQETCVGAAPEDERCDGVDNDCDGQTDEGCDDDKDGYCDATMLVDPSAKTCPKGGGDCDDQDAGRHPGAKETCNGVDDDCNSLADAQDPGLTFDDPQSCENQKGVCAAATKAGDLCVAGKWKPCGDTTYGKHSPFFGPTELCDGKDNTCSGQVDAGCDDDKDGYCDAKFATVGFPLSCTKGGGDCQDDEAAAHPGAQEICDDLDNNCNGSVDELCDRDQDGFCDGALQTVGKPETCPGGGGDCDDLDKGVFPFANEGCNGKDDDCNGETDETFVELGQACSPGAGVCKVTGTVVCAPDGKAATCSVQAGAKGSEICDGLDNDCNGQTDEGCDDDKDGWCDAQMATQGKPAVCPKGGGDCEDSNDKVMPGAKEVCNGLDDDCDGKADGVDGDILFDDPQACESGQGACLGAKKGPNLCVGGKWQPCSAATYTDWSPHYKKEEICDNVDNNCDGDTDEICDTDGDKYCAAGVVTQGFVDVCSKGNGDCNDDNAATHPFANEICDGVDNDCDNQTDEGCNIDGDDYCAQGKQTVGKPSVCKAGGGDCDDDDPKTNPGAGEICADFKDNNCKNGPDDGCPPTVIGFTGLSGPDFYDAGLLQCSGYLDKIGKEDIPTAFGASCTDQQWNRVRIACGASPQSVRWIDVKKNVFKDGILNKVEGGLITDSNFDLGGQNVIAADAESPNVARSWWVAKFGCGEGLANLIVGSEASCGWEAANCFGQNLSGDRYLFVYVGK